MYLNFVNNSNCTMTLKVDNGENIVLQPQETIQISRTDSDCVKISAKSGDSYVEKPAHYHLALETEYLFSDVMDDAIFTFTQEEIEVFYDLIYNRIHVHSESAKKETARYRVLSEERIRNTYKKGKRTDFVINLVMGARLLVILLIAGLSLTLALGWKVALIYFPIAILFYVIFIWLSDKIAEKFAGSIINKIFRVKENTEFHRYFEDDFIKWCFEKKKKDII